MGLSRVAGRGRIALEAVALRAAGLPFEAAAFLRLGDGCRVREAVLVRAARGPLAFLVAAVRPFEAAAFLRVGDGLRVRTAVFAPDACRVPAFLVGAARLLEAATFLREVGEGLRVRAAVVLRAAWRVPAFLVAAARPFGAVVFLRVLDGLRARAAVAALAGVRCVAFLAAARPFEAAAFFRVRAVGFVRAVFRARPVVAFLRRPAGALAAGLRDVDLGFLAAFFMGLLKLMEKLGGKILEPSPDRGLTREVN